MFSFCLKPMYFIVPALLSPCLFLISCLDGGLISYSFSTEMIPLFYLILFTFPVVLFKHYVQVIYTTILTLFISVLCTYIFYQKNQFLYFMDGRGLTFHILMFTLFMFVSHTSAYLVKKQLVYTYQSHRRRML